MQIKCLRMMLRTPSLSQTSEVAITLLFLSPEVRFLKSKSRISYSYFLNRCTRIKERYTQILTRKDKAAGLPLKLIPPVLRQPGYPRGLPCPVAKIYPHNYSSPSVAGRGKFPLCNGAWLAYPSLTARAEEIVISIKVYLYNYWNFKGKTAKKESATLGD